jgi:hypothetical protein
MWKFIEDEENLKVGLQQNEQFGIVKAPEGSFLNKFLRLQKSSRLGNIGFWLSSSIRAA